MSATPFARPRRCHARVRRHHLRRHRLRGRTRGYLLPEVLCALVMLGVGLLPMAGAAVAGLQWLREQAALSRATRVAAEAAEQRSWGFSATLPPVASWVASSAASSPASPVALSRLIAPPRLCAAAPASAIADRCVPGSRLAVVALRASSTTDDGSAASRLRAIALWLTP